MTLEITSIGQLMSDRLETINMSSSAQVASKKMRDKNISSLIVTDDYSKPVGIVTERDQGKYALMMLVAAIRK